MVMDRWARRVGLSSLLWVVSGSAYAQSGFYLGLQGGMAIGNSQASTSYASVGRDVSDNGNLSGRSLLGGVMVGGGGFVGKVYLGLEGGWDYQQLEGSYRQRPAAGINNFVSLQLRQTFDIFGRVGLRPAPKSLIYLKVGSMWGKWTGFSRNLTLNIANNGAASRSLFRPGISGGLGIESVFYSSTKYRGQWVWGGEFLYTGFSSFRLTNINLGTTSFSPRLATITMHIKWTF